MLAKKSHMPCLDWCMEVENRSQGNDVPSMTALIEYTGHHSSTGRERLVAIDTDASLDYTYERLAVDQHSAVACSMQHYRWRLYTLPGNNDFCLSCYCQDDRWSVCAAVRGHTEPTRSQSFYGWSGRCYEWETSTHNAGPVVDHDARYGHGHRSG